ncbi:hypothetical protein AA106555_0273 [Neokomagataea thailandica NBRC 106555]|uniref:Uncharacterized protein n=1 Tax=Neokomagataea thailandica NBRC 106555 TaxID=1223520 RepID=A0ABQ0QMP5_9PROT|nr:hypothetical protein AA106555_0273 [Neokomagataea thailandica NBRC 106555]
MAQNVLVSQLGEWGDHEAVRSAFQSFPDGSAVAGVNICASTELINE